jgi:hypothetical protein
MIWLDFEDVLFEFIGSYYSLLNRIDIVLKTDEPSQNLMDTLPNLFKVSARENYFFENLNKIGWLIPLSKANFFNSDKIPAPIKDSTGKGYLLPYWSALKYIEKITPIADSKNLDEIINIIEPIIK